MKQQHSNRNILFGLTFFVILAFTAMAFQDSSKVNKTLKQARLDTVPKNNIDIQLDMTGVDETVKKSLQEVEKSLKEIDWNKISKQVQLGLKQIDLAKLQVEMDKSINAVDWSKMKQDIDRSVKAIDMSNLKNDLEKMKIEIDQTAKINSEQIRNSLEELKKINFDDMKKDMDKMKLELDLNKDHLKLNMENMKIDMSKLKTELAEIKEMTNEMEKDGLINKGESNTLEYKNKELYINGKKQSPEVSEKYRKYFKGDNSKFNFKGN
jgi:hypothetical protein